jgi:hypothetical protein
VGVTLRRADCLNGHTKVFVAVRNYIGQQPVAITEVILNNTPAHAGSLSNVFGAGGRKSLLQDTPDRLFNDSHAGAVAPFLNTSCRSSRLDPSQN